MRISDLTVSLLILGAVAGPALAQDAGRTGAASAPRAVLAPSPGAAQPVPLAPFSSARDALRAGVKDYNAGDKLGAARALEYAAGQGDALALWKLGKMHSIGDGVPHDDLKAFEYFSKVADEYADETPGTASARIVASAFVQLGLYMRDGIKGTYVKPNAAKAVELFQYAASYYGDADAQYELSRLHLEGRGVAKDPRQAARWLNLSAEKGHIRSQALLGQLMLAGETGMPRQAARGLMWLTLARDSADPVANADIIEAQKKAFEAASQEDREAALIFLKRQMERRR
ncbi:MAG: tetratricopeptide repeat protein [Hyphomicrobiales bacterium]|nr:tetratricopeptide repeat protein [Hyphomicrobiales bacterium]